MLDLIQVGVECAGLGWWLTKAQLSQREAPYESNINRHAKGLNERVATVCLCAFALWCPYCTE